jgi:hypothetical protein
MTSGRIHELRDQRSGRFVYVSSCLLNQNRRFPGIAVAPGIIAVLIEMLTQRDVGLEQLPCIECVGWGGFSRESIFRFVPIFYRFSGSRLFPLVRAFGNLWLYKYRRLCRRKAKSIVSEIKNALSRGYQILGIIAMDDSPTCGINYTLNILDMVPELKKRGLKLKEIQYPSLELMKNHIPELLIEGQGYYMAEIKKLLAKEGIDIPIVGFNPWITLDHEIKRIDTIIFSTDNQ